MTRVSAGASGSVVVLVEELPGAQTGGKIAATADANTRIYRQSGSGTADATLDDLRRASSVSVWITGPMLMSYPSQGKAEAVLSRR